MGLHCHVGGLPQAQIAEFRAEGDAADAEVLSPFAEISPGALEDRAEDDFFRLPNALRMDIGAACFELLRGHLRQIQRLG